MQISMLLTGVWMCVFLFYAHADVVILQQGISGYLGCQDACIIGESNAKRFRPLSDLWPATSGGDDHIYTSWGDGAGFGSDFNEEGGRDRVSLGSARIEGYPPDDWAGVNINGGKNAENPASFLKKGKCGGMLCVNDVLYAWPNLQDGSWPHVNQALAWSTDSAVTWTQASWVWPKGEENFKAQTFLQFGKNYEYARDDYVYILRLHIRTQRNWMGRRGRMDIWPAFIEAGFRIGRHTRSSPGLMPMGKASVTRILASANHTLRIRTE